MKARVMIRLLEKGDIQKMAEAFYKFDWNKSVSLYERYYREQMDNIRAIYVAFVEDQFAGYLTICWTSSYEPFEEENIPEIVDFNVLPNYRRRGIGTQLMDKAESEIAKVSSIAGIGVGMDSDYGPAQRLYALRGYIPDGRGLHYKSHYPAYGEQITVDDSLALYLTKELK
ncbi:MAG TPA: GNAT family N-acetyltransferase [Anaerolineales bacterium]|nr:GNAT family N-acetyltransferase [Anaerolineales bacterium]